MRLTFLRAFLGSTVLVALLPAAVPAQPSADDVSIQVFLESGNTMTSTRGPNFLIRVEIESFSGVRQTVDVTVDLGPGLRWGNDGPDPSELCTTATPATCRAGLEPNPVGTIGLGWQWDVVADAPGAHRITASVQPTEPDPETSNNRDTLDFQVLPAAGGGGGGGGAGARLTAGAAMLTPAPIKAGSIVTAAVRIVLGGAPVRPTGVTCAGTIGGAKVRGVPKAIRGKASCTYRTTLAAKGKTLRGSVAFSARGERYVRRFAARLR